MSQGVEGAASGGLYKQIITADYVNNYPGRKPFEPGPNKFGEFKSWTGSPMASLRRAAVMLGNINLRGVPDDIRDKLRQLQDLYSKDLEYEGSIGEEEEGAEGGKRAGAEGAEGAEGEEEEEAEGEEEEEVEREEWNPRSSQHYIITQQPRNTSPQRWHWGPTSTNQDAIWFFRRVL